MVLEKCSQFHGFGVNFLKAIYELFDNLSNIDFFCANNSFIWSMHSVFLFFSVSLGKSSHEYQ